MISTTVPAEEEARPRWVYTLWSASGECLYVGCTVNLKARLDSHRRAREWWPRVARIESQEHPGWVAGLAAEADTIRRLNPTHNRVFTDHNTSDPGGWAARRRNLAERAPVEVAS